ncbi:hypothetical protein V6N11_051689 [Hibiscus sabdariffa]|uniref:Uncharacterized protein n=1 Tax=Hibiscus sabdariffa TaxID=183260 RepID=A0ABR2U7V8_9ROSI
MQVFNEAVCRDFNANSPKELGPPALLNRPTLRWADVVANNQGRAQQEASASWAHTIDLVNNQSITDFLEVGKPSNLSVGEKQVESKEEDHNLSNTEQLLEICGKWLLEEVEAVMEFLNVSEYGDGELLFG